MHHATALAARILASSALALGVLALATPADAQTPGCVSHREFEQISGHNWTMTRIHRIFETRGVVVLVHEESVARNYQACGDDASPITVYYEWTGRPERRYRMVGAWRNV